MIGFTFPTYAQVKEFWTGYFNNVSKFMKDWQQDVMKSTEVKKD